ncbi:MAG: hypothetical protein RLO81_14790, partial [Fulvivirga sp.]|uniref:hypothetical protein n=1 Tax=Fulvivirga sp. TaxID=1931237 RepID=UPI0032ED3F97
DLTDNSIVYSNHSLYGLNTVEIEFNPSSWTPLSEVEDRNVDILEPIIEQEGHEHILDQVPDKKHASKNYSKIGHMFNIHSWGPFLNTGANTIQAGLFSRDVLSSTRASVGYTYDAVDQTGFTSAKISYQGWFPVIDLQYDFGNRRTSTYEWVEKTTNVGLSIPLNLTNSKFFESLTFSNAIGIREISKFERRSGTLGGRDSFDDYQIIDRSVNPNDTIIFRGYQVDTRELDNGEMIFNNFSVRYSNLLKRSPRNFESLWGQIFVFEQFNTISGDFNGSLTGFRAAFYFPSPIYLINKNLFKSHSLNFRFGYQKREINDDINLYSFQNVIFKPRGYAYPNEESFTSFITNYEFPIGYPDFSIGPVINVKRIRLNSFFDFGNDNVIQTVFTTEPTLGFRENDSVGNFNTDSQYLSYGTELTFDLNLMRFPLDLEVGVRWVTTERNAWNEGGSSIEIIFAGVNL